MLGRAHMIAMRQTREREAMCRMTARPCMIQKELLARPSNHLPCMSLNRLNLEIAFTNKPARLACNHDYLRIIKSFVVIMLITPAHPL
jgi:hypothetical protein